MKKTLLSFSIFILLVSCDFWQDAKLRKELDKDPELKRSYNIGNKIARQLTLNLKDDNDKEKKAFILGFQDGLKEDHKKPTKKEYNQESTEAEETNKIEQKDEKNGYHTKTRQFKRQGIFGKK